MLLPRGHVGMVMMCNGADDQADHDDRKRAPDPDQYFQLSRHELHRISPSSAPHPGSVLPTC